MVQEIIDRPMVQEIIDRPMVQEVIDRPRAGRDLGITLEHQLQKEIKTENMFHRQHEKRWRKFRH